jgi:cobalt-zinc-cadmium efflux system membrane fusion protein
VEDSSEKSQPAGTKDTTKDGAQKRFQMIEVRRGVSVGGWTEVSLPSSFDASRANVVVKGAYSLLSKMQGAE